MNHLAPLTALVRQATAFELPTEAVLSDADVIEAQRLLGELKRVADAHSARVAAVIAHRSRRELGYDGLAQRLGARTPQELVQKVTGVGKREASTLVRVGELMDAAPSASDHSPVPPWLVAVGDAVACGGISVEAAGVIRSALTGVGAADDALLSAAIELIAAAGKVGVDRLVVHARQLRDLIDAEHVAAREQELREKRYLRLFPLPNGMTRITGELDPESAAQVCAVVDAATSPRRGGPRFVDPAGKAREQRLLDDTRSTDQLAVDALVSVLRIGLDGDVSEVVGRQVPAVRIHVTATDLERDTGAAHLEGQTASISIATAKRHACTAGVIPIAFDSDGQVVNVGRAQRLFTQRQRVGLAARDGGCRFPDCDRPPGWTEAHHINEWDRDHGRTDLSDGVLLCRHHHMLVHNNGWQVTRTGAEYFVIPPRSIDPEQRPIPAPSQRRTRLRFAVGL
jgi:hypothetical protein